jgi:predicted TIM-barrel fold metal-dependent hydrolase
MHSHPYPENMDDLDKWVKTMDKVGIRKSIILTYSYGSKFDSLVHVFNKYPDRFELWCGFDYSLYDTPEFPESAIRELKRCHDMGARGVGELGDKGKGLFYSKPPAWGMHSDDNRMVPLFSACAKLNMPVNLHIADPKWMYEPMDKHNDGLMNAYKWRLDNQEGIVNHEGMIRILENTLRMNPETTFIACHLANCCYDLDKIGNLLDKYENLNIDISARYAEFSPIPRTARKFFIRHQDKIVYGTDMGMAGDMYQLTFRILETEDEHFYVPQHSSYHWAMNGLDLPIEVLEKVYYLNASKLTGRK